MSFRIKRKFLLLILTGITMVAKSQVELSVPYVNGQVTVVAHIAYPKTIKTADSVCLEACYQTYSEMENSKLFKREKSVKGLATSITKNHSFAFKPNWQTYRVLVYQKGKKVLKSNEVSIDYNAYKYDTSKLAKVTGIKAIVTDKNGQKKVTLSWNAVPGAFGYVFGIKAMNEGNMKFTRFQINHGQSSETIETSITFEVSSGKEEYGIVAVNSPKDESLDTLPQEEIGSITVTVP